MRADGAALNGVVVVPFDVPSTASRVGGVQDVVFDVNLNAAEIARICSSVDALHVAVNSVVIHITGDRTAGVLTLKRLGGAGPVDDIPSPGDISRVAGGAGLQIESLPVLLSAETVMHDVIVHHGALYILHVDTIVRPAITLVPLDHRTAGIAMDLDAVVAIAIADFV